MIGRQLRKCNILSVGLGLGFRQGRRGLASPAVEDITALGLYKLKVSNGETQYDETQYKVLQRLEKLQKLMATTSFAPGEKRPRGAYLCGSVGIGKTMMMDMFFETCRVEKKRRVHFHHFMLEIHRRVHEYKKELIRVYGRDRHINLSSERDAIAAVARAVSDESRLLCFDEFHVTDIADALVMTRLFGELWQQGTVLVATSNRHPDDLYENGLNRSYFMPFIDLLKQQCMTIELNTVKDYRMEAVAEKGSYFVPLSDLSRADLREAFLQSRGAEAGGPVTERVAVMMGRHIDVEALGDSCFATFKDLCEANRGPADYHAICRRFDCIFVDGIRQLSLREHNIVRRLIMLIDVIYDSGVKLVWCGEVGPQELFTDMFVEGKSNLKVLVESDDLSPFDPKNEEEITQRSKAAEAKANTGSTHHIHHHVPSSGKTDSITFPMITDADDSNTFQIMKGETAAFRDLEFAVRRAISRLIEMSGKQYMEAGATGKKLFF